MKKLLFVIVAAVLAIVLGLTSVLASSEDLQKSHMDGEPAFPDQRVAAQQATQWMVLTHQNDDGGYTNFSAGANLAPSTVGGTIDALLALGSAGYSGSEPFPGKSNAPLDYMVENAADVVAYAGAADAGIGASQAAKLVLALTAVNEDPRSFVDHNFVISVTERLEPSGSFGVSDAFKQSLAILALVSAREPIPSSAVSWLIDLQAENGSWDDGFGTLDNSDATAIAIMALVAAGESPVGDAISTAVTFLAGAQLDDGSWEYGPGFGSSASSTALVAQALSALDEDWYTETGVWARDGVSPLHWLLSNQASSGAFQADFGQGPFEDFFTTAQIIPAIVGNSYVFQTREEAVQAGLSCLTSIQDATGGWEQIGGEGPDAGGTSRAIQAIVAAGEDPQGERWTPDGGENAVEAMESLTPAYLSNGRGGRAGVVAQGVVAAGEPYSVTDFAGQDLTVTISGYLSPTGEYDSTASGITGHSEAMLGLIAGDAPVDPTALDFLFGAQTGGDWGSSVQNGIALQVLGALNKPFPRSTLSVLKVAQLSEGGWGSSDEVSPSVTAEVALGLAAVGQNPFGPQWSVTDNGRVVSPADAVMALQMANGCWQSDSGSGDDPFNTVDAIIMLSLEPSWGFYSVNVPVIAGGQ